VNYVVCVPDGCPDERTDLLDGRTPLEAADLPILSGLAARGTVGGAAMIPAGLAPGSDVGNMSILGYDPADHHTGRAPIEAAALGLRLGVDEIAFRCNLVTIGDDGTMVDFAGGHPSSEEAAEVIAALESELGGGGVHFHPGVQYRHIVVAPATWSDADCVPPHDLTDKPVVWPTGAAATKVREVMEASRDVLSRFELPANAVWLWGQGPQPQLPSFWDRHGVEAGLVTAVDLVRGLGVLTGMRVFDVPGATGWYDTNYEGKRDAALAGLDNGLDLFVIHVEATDEAGHAGDATEKVRALENWDRRILADLVAGLDERGPWRLLLVPDHPTPLDLKTHTTDPVPYLLVDSEVDGPGGVYTEAGVVDADVVPGHSLLNRLLQPT
jgi:2,3-bisphosphoglycerate-independent phosphoglycerate mutase